MLKIATVLMTTTVFAGLLISGPTSLVTASLPSGQFAAVKVKTISIHVPATLTRVANPTDLADLLDPNPLYVPAVHAGKSNDRRA